jgi:hypothetical protein
LRFFDERLIRIEGRKWNISASFVAEARVGVCRHGFLKRLHYEIALPHTTQAHFLRISQPSNSEDFPTSACFDPTIRGSGLKYSRLPAVFFGKSPIIVIMTFNKM